MSNFELTLRTADGRQQTARRIQNLLSLRDTGERWMFIVPHDDDSVVGAGLLLQKAVEDRVAVKVLITTDGSLGYCDGASRNDIVDIRRRETESALGDLGVADVTWLAYPDCRTGQFIGRWPKRSDGPTVIEGYDGLENAYTFHLRAYSPTRVFVASAADIHPDHQVVHREVLISMFHATGAIWPELGPPLIHLPRLTEMAVYCDFPAPPNIRITAGQQQLATKLSSIRRFRSQQQIEQLVSRVEQAGPVEYFRDIDIRFYNPAEYTDLFR